MSAAVQSAWCEEDILDCARLAARLNAGADANEAVGSFSRTVPLAVAAREGNVDACRLLLKAGADPAGESDTGKTVFQYAMDARGWSTSYATGELIAPKLSDRAAKELFALLVEYGASPNGKSSRSRFSIESPVFDAIRLGDEVALSILVELGAWIDPDAPARSWADADFLTPLRYAKTRAQGEVAFMLLRLGARDDVLAEKGRTPFQVCVASGWVRAVEYYVFERGEDLAQRAGGRSLLQIARTPEMKELLRSIVATRDIAAAVSSGEAETAVRSTREGFTL